MKAGAENETVRVLGIDPGYAILGYGIIDYAASRHRLVTYGAVTTDKSMSAPDRLKTIHEELTALIDDYRPDAAAVEELFFNSNAKTAIKVGEARGVAIAACACAGVEVYEYTPLQIKQSLTGYGRAEKAQMQDMVRMILGLSKAPKPDDAADAVAAAICHANSSVSLGRIREFTGVKLR